MSVIYPLDKVPPREEGLRVFLAGGISNCPNWQAIAIDLLKEKDGLRIINPRRDNFENASIEEMEEQIRWEAAMIGSADLFIFWFPKDTLCPITLFEYGKVLEMKKPVFVGADPDYARRFDLIVQTSCMDESIEIQSSIEDTVALFLASAWERRLPGGI